MRRRGLGFLVAIVVTAVIGVIAYNIGFDRGLAQAGQAGDIVRYVGGPWFGFFPFGLILFPLFLFGIFALLGRAFWRLGGGRGYPGPELWRDRAEDWHRRQHQPASDQPPQIPQTQL